jgi:hypothetical protein
MIDNPEAIDNNLYESIKKTYRDTDQSVQHNRNNKNSTSKQMNTSSINAKDTYKSNVKGNLKIYKKKCFMDENTEPKCPEVQCSNYYYSNCTIEIIQYHDYERNINYTEDIINNINSVRDYILVGLYSIPNILNFVAIVGAGSGLICGQNRVAIVILALCGTRYGHLAIIL